MKRTAIKVTEGAAAVVTTVGVALHAAAVAVPAVIGGGIAIACDYAERNNCDKDKPQD